MSTSAFGFFTGDAMTATGAAWYKTIAVEVMTR
jgi:hypothetical protein